MPGRFPLTPVPLTNDPFCEDGFCNDTDGSFDPSIFGYARWVGTINYATFDGNVDTPYFIDTPKFTGAWNVLNTIGGVKDALALLNNEVMILPTGILIWKASQIFNFNTANYPTNRLSNPITLVKYNPNAPATGYTLPGVTPAADSPPTIDGGIGAGVLWGFSGPITNPPALTSYGGTFYSVVEVNKRVSTYKGVFEFSNNASTVLATWNGL